MEKCTFAVDGGTRCNRLPTIQVTIDGTTYHLCREHYILERDRHTAYLKADTIQKLKG